jgi:malonyl-CoA decarboxylase
MFARLKFKKIKCVRMFKTSLESSLVELNSSLNSSNMETISIQKKILNLSKDICEEFSQLSGKEKSEFFQIISKIDSKNLFSKQFFHLVVKQNQGIKYLLEMRSFLMVKDSFPDIEKTLKNLFNLWFSPSLLKVEQLNWSSSAADLENIIKYEGVHKMNSFDDLKIRMTNNKRVYVLKHLSMNEIPLNFIQIALTSKISNNVQVIR